MNKHYFTYPPHSLCIIFILLAFSACQPDEGPIADKEKSLSELLERNTTIILELNPYEVAPLSAKASFSTRADCHISLEITGPIPVIHNFESRSQQHEVPIIGLYPDQTNEVILTITDESGFFAKDTLRISTPPLPHYLPEIRITQAQLGKMEAGMNLSAMVLGKEGKFIKKPIIFDANGIIRWYLDWGERSDLGFSIRQLKDGNMAFYTGTKVLIYSMLGEEIQRIELNSYKGHHDLIELPNGNLVLAVDKDGTMVMTSSGMQTSIEDHIIEIERESGQIVQEWDLRQILDVDRYDYFDGQGRLVSHERTVV